MIAFLLLVSQISLWVSPGRLVAWAKLEPSFVLVEDPAQAEVLLSAGEPPEKGAPGVVFGPPGALLDKPVSIQYVGPPEHPFAIIDWNSAPQVALHTEISVLPGETVLVATGEGAPFVVAGPGGVRWGAVVGEENRQFLEWPALPYLIYASVVLAAEETPEPFATWNASPLPGGVAGWVVGGVGGLVILSLFLFFLARKLPKERAEEEFCQAMRALSGEGGRDKWQKISFSRPLAGFLFFLATQLLFLLLLGYVTEVVFPNWVQPFPLADGMWAWITTTFAVVWYLFDAGTRDAFIKLFAEKRLSAPKEALRYAQFFVWWQLLTGVLQIVFITALVLGPMARSSYALYAWPLLLHSIAQWPGVQGVFQAYFIAMQRFDYAQILNLIVGVVLGLIVPLGAVLLFRSWGAAHPSYGEAFGALFGLAVTSYVVQLGTLSVGAVLARRARFPIRALFAASFDKKTAKEMLSYGMKMTLGQLPNQLSFAVNNYILKARLLNYGELSGIYGRLDSNFLKYFKWSYTFYSSGVPTFSEAFGEKKFALVRYYVARFWQYGALFAAIIFAFVVSTGAAFVHYALDPQWARIADYILLASVVGLLVAPSWLSDALQQGAGRPGLFGVLVASEQLARIGLLLVLIGPFQFHGFLLAIAIPLFLKNVIAWTLNHRWIIKIPFYPWPHLWGPLLAGGILYTLFSGLTLLVDSGISASVLFFGGGLLAMVLGFFLGGLLGIFDQKSQEEMADAARMTGGFSLLLRPMAFVVALGLRLSPFQGRYFIPFEEATREAEQLERMSSGRASE